MAPRMAKQAQRERRALTADQAPTGRTLMDVPDRKDRGELTETAITERKAARETPATLAFQARMAGQEPLEPQAEMGCPEARVSLGNRGSVVAMGPRVHTETAIMDIQAVRERAELTADQDV